jgi:hypothetical protein
MVDNLEPEGPALAVPPASVLPALPSWLHPVALPAAGLFGAALCTALAGLHLSRAHGPVLAWHALAGLLGLALALAAVLWTGHRARRSRTWSRVAVAAALIAVGIAAVDTAMLCWYAFDRLLSST